MLHNPKPDAAQSASLTVLTSFKCHDAFQTGKFCGVEAHLSKSGDHLLKGLDLRHDLRHPLRLCVFRVHSCGQWQSERYVAGCAYSGQDDRFYRWLGLLVAYRKRRGEWWSPQEWPTVRCLKQTVPSKRPPKESAAQKNVFFLSRLHMKSFFISDTFH